MIWLRIFASLPRLFRCHAICSALALLVSIDGCFFASASWAQNESSPAAQDRSGHANLCSENGMRLIEFGENFREICEPRGATMLLKISDCLSKGLEAVLVEDSGVVCAIPHRGEKYLDEALVAGSLEKKRYPKFHMIPKSLCPQHGGRGDDKRLLDRRIVKNLVSQSQGKVDPTGVRLIGGIFCEGIDLTGLDIPYSLILDRSIFVHDVEVRNLHAKGDLSLDNTAIYESARLTRAEIGGSLYASFAFINKLNVADSIIKGSIKLNNSVIPEHVTIENVSVAGDIDISTRL